MPLVECVPNISEGRRPEVVEAVAAEVRAVSGVQLLDVESDVDHNRSVLTFVGEPEPVAEAAFRVVRRAAQLIDLNAHRGEHPRIGATDVVPFVPVSGIGMPECVALARRLAERIARELGIPVYLYREAATGPERYDLPAIRRGEYEGLREAIRSDPARAPDFGPRELGPAGATVVGARAFLIAYNLYLNTPDVEVARRVAKAVRFSSGGLRFLQAKGFLVGGLAQVSMNLTDFTQTPLAQVVELVRREAARHGALVVRSELVGLIPQQALVDAAAWYTQLDGLRADQILENRLRAAAGPDTAGPTLAGFVDAVAANTAAPGGGAVAALAGALSAALVAMVAGLTAGKKKYAEAEEAMRAALAAAEPLRAELSDLIAADSEAYGAVMAAYQLERDDPRREPAVQAALGHAADVPLQTARAALAVLELARTVAARGNVNAASDAGTAALLARASLEAAGLNVRTNAALITDEARRAELLAAIEALRARAAELEAQVLASVAERAGI
jgi:glutamate formiminotransferase/formiminotetrahydrofolate cyclodeaminase